MLNVTLRAALLCTALTAGTAAHAVPTTLFDFGNLNDGAGGTGSLTTNIVWFSFEITSATYVDIHTNGSLIDTEIGLYDATGNLIANDDDDGIGLDSVLSFGTGSGQSLGDFFNLGGNGIAEGENGALGPGLYYLAIGRFNTFFANDFDVTGSQSSGQFTLTFLTDNTALSAVPAPIPAALLVGGLAAFVGLRRKARA